MADKEKMEEKNTVDSAENKSSNPFGKEADNNQENDSCPTPENTCENAEGNSEEEKLEKKIECEFETLQTQYVRLAADFDNYRKRQAQERESLLKYGAEETLKKLLPVLDTFERAKKSIVNLDDPEKIKESVDVLQKQFIEALEKAGLQKIEVEGKEFDPNLHEAVMQTPTNDHPDHTVINELQSGYKLNDRVLRPALVNVAVNE